MALSSCRFCTVRLSPGAEPHTMLDNMVYRRDLVLDSSTPWKYPGWRTASGSAAAK
jgi:hypothetical protein